MTIHQIIILFSLMSVGTVAEENRTNATLFNFLFLRKRQHIENEIALLSKMAEHRLRADGKIPDWLEFNTIIKASCEGYTEMYAYDPVVDAAQVYYSTKVDCILGPECSVGILKVGHLAWIWNIPIMAYRSLGEGLTDRIQFPTMSRVSTPFSSIGDAVVDLIHHLKWKQVGIVKDPFPDSSGSMRLYRGIMQALKSAGIKINVDISIEMTNLKTEAPQLFKKLKGKARIIIVVVSFYANPVFMETLVEHNMTQPDYFYLVPSAPPRGTSGFTNIPAMSEAAKKGYSHSLVISAHGEDTETQERFMERLYEEQNVTLPDNVPDSGKTRRGQYAVIHDSFYVLMKVAGELAFENKLDQLYNGRLFWKRLPFRKFDGASGRVLLDDTADRIPNYRVETAFQNTQKLVFSLDVIAECQGSCYTSGEQILVKSGKITHRWIPSLLWKAMNEYMTIPPDEPPCGFIGEKCDKTNIFLAVGGILLLVGITIFAYIMYEKKKKKDLLRMPWRVAPDAIVPMKTNHSLGSIGSFESVKSHSYLGGQDIVRVSHDICKSISHLQLRKIDFTREQLAMLNQVKAIQHDNLSSFVGICFNNDRAENMAILWKIGSRGTLEDIIFNTDLQLDRVFQASFIRDVVRGMEYLHESPVKVHGALNVGNCLVTSHWMVKISNFGLQPLLCDLSAEKAIKYTKENWTRLIHVAPELLLAAESLDEPIMESEQGDIYSIGILIYQILYRQDPFDFGEIASSAEEILNNWLGNNENQPKPKPILPNDKIVDHMSVKILRECWNENPETRPTLSEIRYIAKSTGSNKGSLVDNMMKMMDTYAGNLEKLVKERTSLLEDAQRRADQLLFQMLPMSVALDLKAGKAVEPKIFSSATIFFSDIVGFTTICSKSTPLEIVNFLNDLFSRYDAIIEARDAFKVETIGDAYMVASGLPKPNGDSHSYCIGVIALLMRQVTDSFKLAHDPEKEMKIRVGIASGSVATGVIGRTSPRYCLFGDTVNTASRMESTGEAMKIQITESTQILLDKYGGQFVTYERGQISVKGKGTMTTHWLEEGPEFNEKL